MEKSIKKVYTCITESCCCIADWHNIVNQQYSVKNKVKYNTNEPVYETERDSQRVHGGGKNWNFSRCKLLHREWINDKVLLCRTILSTLR